MADAFIRCEGQGCVEWCGVFVVLISEVQRSLIDRTNFLPLFVIARQQHCSRWAGLTKKCALLLSLITRVSSLFLLGCCASRPSLSWGVACSLVHPRQHLSVRLIPLLIVLHRQSVFFAVVTLQKSSTSSSPLSVSNAGGCVHARISSWILFKTGPGMHFGGGGIWNRNESSRLFVFKKLTMAHDRFGREAGDRNGELGGEGKVDTAEERQESERVDKLGYGENG